jgi:hypothetical protein
VTNGSTPTGGTDRRVPGRWFHGRYVRVFRLSSARRAKSGGTGGPHLAQARCLVALRHVTIF